MSDPFSAFDYPYGIRLVRQGTEEYDGGVYTETTNAPVTIKGHLAPFYRIEEEGRMFPDRDLGVIQEGEMGFFTYHELREKDILEVDQDEAGTWARRYVVVAVKRKQTLMQRYLGGSLRYEAAIREMVE